MARRKLTEASVKKVAPPAEGRIEIFDQVVSGMALRVSSTGAKSFCIFYRREDGKQRRMTLGSYPKIGLKDAREMARTALVQVFAGGDPAEMKKAAKRESRAKPQTFADLRDRFAEQYLAGKKSGGESKRVLTVNFPNGWQSKAIDGISRGDVLEVLETIETKRGPIMANRSLAAIRKMFNWSVDRGLMESNPAAGIKSPAPESKRDRVLSNTEIKSVWDAAGKMDYPFGGFFRLLLITGQRRDEVAGMKMVRDRPGREGLDLAGRSDEGIALASSAVVASGAGPDRRASPIHHRHQRRRERERSRIHHDAPG